MNIQPSHTTLYSQIGAVQTIRQHHKTVPGMTIVQQICTAATTCKLTSKLVAAFEHDPQDTIELIIWQLTWSQWRLCRDCITGVSMTTCGQNGQTVWRAWYILLQKLVYTQIAVTDNNDTHTHFTMSFVSWPLGVATCHSRQWPNRPHNTTQQRRFRFAAISDKYRFYRPITLHKCS